MDPFTRDDLDTLVNPPSHPCLSIYMPTHRTGREIREDSLRCKNLLATAEEQLKEAGVKSGDIKDMLQPARELHGDGEFWKRQSDGLAMFASPGWFKSFRVPIELEELVRVNQRFHVTGLLPLLQDDGQFYLLSASQKQLRFFSGTHYNISRIESDVLPTSLRDALRVDEYVTSLQHHAHHYPNAATSGGEEAMFHGHGGSDLSTKKNDELREYFRRIDDALDELLGPENMPLVFAGVEYLFPIFRDACSYRRLLDEPVRGNPDNLSDKELHQKAWPIVEKDVRARQDGAVERFGNAISSDMAVHNTRDIVKAAHRGVVDTLFVQQGRHLWGRYDEQSGDVENCDEKSADADDLLDFAAIHTLLHGGTVYVLEKDRMPQNETPVAAILRYAEAQ